MSNIADIAKAFTDLCKKGELEQAGAKYWADNVVSHEAMEGPMARIEGKAGVKGKGDWWYSNNTVHSVTADGPYVFGDQFLVRFKMDVTPKGGARMQMDEMGLYTVKNGKITEEKFFYGQ